MAIHIKELNIDTFRGIKDLEIKNFGDINIITGDNNTGKTSVLEIINTLASPCEIKTWLTIGDRIRNTGIGIYDRFDMLFNVNSDIKNIKYTVEHSSGTIDTIKVQAEEKCVELSYGEMESIDEFGFSSLVRDNYDEDMYEFLEDLELKTQEVNQYDILFELNDDIIKNEQLYDFQISRKPSKEKVKQKQLKKVVYISPTQHSWSDVFLSEILDNPSLYQEMLTVLRLFDDGILSINADASKHKTTSKPIYKILSKNNKNAIPLNFYGDGIKKAILLLSAVVTAKDGILLLDEFEIAIHTSAMNEIFAWIINTCIKLNVQLFMTSHSEEAIDKVLKCSPEIQDKMRLITLYSNEDKTVSRVLDGKKAIKLKDDLGVELR